MSIQFIIFSEPYQVDKAIKEQLKRKAFKNLSVLIGLTETKIFHIERATHSTAISLLDCQHEKSKYIYMSNTLVTQNLL